MLNTLTEILAHHAEASAGQVFVHVLEKGVVRDSRTYAQAWDRANAWALALGECGVRRGDSVVLALPNGVDFVDAYFGALLAGAVPAPIAPIRRGDGGDPYLRIVAGRLHFVDAKALIVPDGLAGIDALPQLQGPAILTPAQLRPGASRLLPHATGDDLALIQFTSGTSGNSKAVKLTHAALLAQIRALSDRLQLVDRTRDWGVSWLPLFHDMGLIGFLLTPAYHAGTVYLMPTEDFILRPGTWLQAITEFKATITGAPPSAYALCARRIKDAEMGRYNLSSIRIALVGAEQVRENALREFADKFHHAGFRRTALMPTYGLAENSLAVTLPPLARGPVFDTVDHAGLSAGKADPLPGGAGARADQGKVFASVGLPLPQTEVAIVGESGERLGERRVGEVILRSPSLMAGYHRQETETRQALRDGWLWTGDLGYLADGELYITGRKKELIITGGRNYFPDDVEAVAADVPGVRAGRTVAFGCEDAERATEVMVVLAETALTGLAEREDLRLGIRQALTQSGYPVGEVVLLKPKTIPSTLNGKPMRVECRARYLAGEYRFD